MRTALSFLTTSAFAALFSMPALGAAHMTATDVSTMTCAEFLAMDRDGMMSAAQGADMTMQMEAMSDDDKKTFEDRITSETAGMTDEQRQQHRMTAMQTDMQARVDAMTADQKTEHTKAIEATQTKMEANCKEKGGMVMDAIQVQ